MAAAEDPKNYAVDVTRVDVSPNQCPIDSPLNLDVDFSVALPVEAGTWSVKVRTHVFVCGRRSVLQYADAPCS